MEIQSKGRLWVGCGATLTALRDFYGYGVKSVKNSKRPPATNNYQRKTHARINGQLEFGFHRSPPATNNFIYISTPKLACRLQPEHPTWSVGNFQVRLQPRIAAPIVGLPCVIYASVQDVHLQGIPPSISDGAVLHIFIAALCVRCRSRESYSSLLQEFSNSRNQSNAMQKVRTLRLPCRVWLLDGWLRAQILVTFLILSAALCVSFAEGFWRCLNAPFFYCNSVFSIQVLKTWPTQSWTQSSMPTSTTRPPTFRPQRSRRLAGTGTPRPLLAGRGSS